MLLVLVAVGVGAFCWGRHQNAEAQPPGLGEHLRGDQISAKGGDGTRIVEDTPPAPPPDPYAPPTGYAAGVIDTLTPRESSS